MYSAGVRGFCIFTSTSCTNIVTLEQTPKSKNTPQTLNPKYGRSIMLNSKPQPPSANT